MNAHASRQQSALRSELACLLTLSDDMGSSFSFISFIHHARTCSFLSRTRSLAHTHTVCKLLMKMCPAPSAGRMESMPRRRSMRRNTSTPRWRPRLPPLRLRLSAASKVSAARTTGGCMYVRYELGINQCPHADWDRTSGYPTGSTTVMYRSELMCAARMQAGAIHAPAANLSPPPQHPCMHTPSIHSSASCDHSRRQFNCHHGSGGSLYGAGLWCGGASARTTLFPQLLVPSQGRTLITYLHCHHTAPPLHATEWARTPGHHHLNACRTP